MKKIIETRNLISTKTLGTVHTHTHTHTQVKSNKKEIIETNHKEKCNL